MIDIHSHILPSVDDGSRSIEESIKMINNAIECGITDIILTPHYIKNTKFNKNKDIIKEVYNNLVDKTKKLNINLHLGNEVHYNKNMLSIIDNVSTLNGTNYILIELPMNEMPNNVLNELHELMIKGYKIIIAHPERYLYFQEDINKMIMFLDKNILFQANASSLFGIYGKKPKKALKRMIKHNMIHFLASDSHSKDDMRYDYMKKLEKNLNSNLIYKFTKTNPNLVLENKLIQNNNYTFSKGTLKDYFIKIK